MYSITHHPLHMKFMILASCDRVYVQDAKVVNKNFVIVTVGE